MTKRLGLIFIVFFLNVGLLKADTTSVPWYSVNNNQVQLRVDLFLSSTCLHCQQADLFFKAIEPTTPWIVVYRHFINQDRTALETFNQYLKQQNLDDFSVPAIFFCNTRWVGFATPQNTGKELLRGLDYCRQQIAKEGNLSAQTVRILKQWANASWYQYNFNNLTPKGPSAGFYLPVMALLDALNPCALFVLLTLFSLIWLSQEKRYQIFSILIFLVTIGLVHFLQQRELAFFIKKLIWIRIPVVFIGIMLLLYLWAQQKRKLSHQKEKFYILFFSFFLGFAVQAYQQTCLPNFALVFEQWMSNQTLSNTKLFLYEFSYQFVYLFVSVLLVGLFYFLTKLSRLKRSKHVISLTIKICLAILAILLIINPSLLSHFSISFATIIFGILMGFLLRKRVKT